MAIFAQSKCVRYSRIVAGNLFTNGQIMRYLPCPNCDCRNTAEAKFCNDCGAQLRLKPCSKCGFRPLVVADRCDGCGIHRPEESLLETDPPNELPVLKDQLPEDSSFDVPMLREMWPSAAKPVEPARTVLAKPVEPSPIGLAKSDGPSPIGSAKPDEASPIGTDLTTVVSTATALSSSVTVDAPQPVNQGKRLRTGVLLAMFGVVAVGAVLLFQGAKPPAQSSATTGALPNQTSIVKPSAGNIDRVSLPAAAASVAAPISAPAAASDPASTSTPAPATTTTTTTTPAAPTAPTAPTAAPRSGECSAALIALSLCSDSSPKQEPKP